MQFIFRLLLHSLHCSLSYLHQTIAKVNSGFSHGKCNISNTNGNNISHTTKVILFIILLLICTWTLWMMPLVIVVPFGNCTCSGYIAITGNYNAHNNFISVKLCNSPESMSTLKLFPMIFIGKQNSTALVPDVTSCCIYNAQVLSVMAGPITIFLAY